MKKILFLLGLTLILMSLVSCDAISGVSVTMTMDSSLGTITEASYGMLMMYDEEWTEEDFEYETITDMNRISQITRGNFTIPLLSNDTPDEITEMIGFLGWYIAIFEHERISAEESGEEFEYDMPDFIFHLQEASGRQIRNVNLSLDGRNYSLTEVREQPGTFTLTGRTHENFISAVSAAFTEIMEESNGIEDLDMSLVLTGQFRGSGGDSNLPPLGVGIAGVVILGGGAAGFIIFRRRMV